MPETCENWLSLVNSEIYQVLSYSVDSNPLKIPTS